MSPNQWVSKVDVIIAELDLIFRDKSTSHMHMNALNSWYMIDRVQWPGSSPLFCETELFQ